VDSRVIVRVREFLVSRAQRVRVGGEPSKEIRCATRERFGPTTISSVHKRYLEKPEH
jgi:hypothetical protein